MAKIAADLNRALADRIATGAAGRTTAQTLARGDGWTVSDVICTCGPEDRPFEEQHSQVSLAIVAAGSFQYRSALGRELMTPGSVLLGNARQCYECGHEHRLGDRCVSFWYTPQYLERIAADVGMCGRDLAFRTGRLPPIRQLAPLVARACERVCGPAAVSWEEIGVELAARVIQFAIGARPQPAEVPSSAERKVTDVVRFIERQEAERLTLGALAREAGLSPFHFLRTFERVTGVTPHQYVLRARLRDAAIRLSLEPGKVLDIALDSGFGDVSNFNRAFRAEFGVSPRRYRGGTPLALPNGRRPLAASVFGQ